MDAAEPAAATLHFSTRELAPTKRLPAVRELFDRSVQLAIDADPDQAVEMEMLLTPGLRRARMLSEFTARLSRPAPMLSDGEDTICLMIKTGGHMAVHQGHREGTPGLGDGVLLVYREPANLQFLDATYVSVRVPFAAISPLTEDVAAAAARCIPRDLEALSLLRDYIANLPKRFSDSRLGRLSATHIYDLIAMAVGATAEGRDIAGQRGVRMARLEALKSDIIQEKASNIDQLAMRHGISPRYIQMLFEESGTTYSQFALDHRLERAYRMLCSPRYDTWSIVTIAAEVGFNDLSHFNRRFRRRYDMTPSDVRSPRSIAPSL